MKSPRELTRAQLEQIVGQIQNILRLDSRTGAFDPDVSRDSRTIQRVSGVLEDAGLRPEALIRAMGGEPGCLRRPAPPEGDIPLRCPACGEREDLLVRVSTLCALVRDGERPGRPTIVLDDKTPADFGWTAFHCGACGHEGARNEFEAADALDRAGPDEPADAVQAALQAFIESIEVTGGCLRDEGGEVAPVGDPDWIDLADVYLRACAALERTPLIAEAEDAL
jgi:hypothetical protein